MQGAQCLDVRSPVDTQSSQLCAIVLYVVTGALLQKGCFSDYFGRFPQRHQHRALGLECGVSELQIIRVQVPAVALPGQLETRAWERR